MVLTVGVLMMCVGMHAHAATKSYTASFGPNQTNFTDTLGLQQFNPTFGTLTGVTLTYSETASSIGSATNFSRNQNLLYSVFNSNVISTTGSTSFITLTAGATTANANQSGTITPDTSPGNTGNTVPINMVNTNGTTQTFGALAGFEGAGNLDFLYTGTGSASDSPSSNQDLSVRTNGSGMITVTYNYNPIPEASTLLGLGGLLGVGGLQLRRLMRKKA
jgi:hypothetical protein